MVLRDIFLNNLLAKRREISHPLMELRYQMNRMFDHFYDDFDPQLLRAHFQW